MSIYPVAHAHDDTIDIPKISHPSGIYGCILYDSGVVLETVFVTVIVLCFIKLELDNIYYNKIYLTKNVKYCIL